MKGFKLIAIKPLKGCDNRFLKNLKTNEIYKFYNDFGELINAVYGDGGIISSSEVSEPTTSEDTIIAVLVMPESQEMFIEVQSEDVEVTTASRTSSRYS